MASPDRRRGKGRARADLAVRAAVRALARGCSPVPAQPGHAVEEALRRQRLQALLGPALTAVAPPERPAADGGAAALLVTTQAVVERLDRADVRAVVLKGPDLAERLHGDPAMRASVDVDVLVAPADLGRATAALAAVGYRAAPGHLGESDIHVRLENPKLGLPTVDLHWRLHWYDDGLAERVLARRLRRRGVPVPCDDDDLVLLLVVHARDGLSGLRAPADVAAWIARRSADEARRVAGEAAASHRALGPSLRAAARAVGAVLDLPLTTDRGTAAERAAARLARWRLDVGLDQLVAEVALCDLLLAPCRRSGWTRRWLLPPAALLDVRYGGRAPTRQPRRALWRAAQAGKLLARIARASPRLLRRGPGRMASQSH